MDAPDRPPSFLKPSSPHDALLADPVFYAVGVPAVILVGISKGGLGGAMALIGLP